jgi:hypothetical protein
MLSDTQHSTFWYWERNCKELHYMNWLPHTKVSIYKSANINFQLSWKFNANAKFIQYLWISDYYIWYHLYFSLWLSVTSQADLYTDKSWNSFLPGQFGAFLICTFKAIHSAMHLYTTIKHNQ